MSGNSDIQFLKNHQISKVLCEGFAQIYNNKPKCPVTYLANFLLSYSKTQIQQQKIQSSLAQKKRIVIENKKTLAQLNNKKQQAKLLNIKLTKQEDAFKNTIKNQQDHYQYLSTFCEKLEKLFNLNGVYVGQLKFPKRKILQHQQSITSHLQLQQPKRIQYIAYSNSHQNIMQGKHLPVQSLSGSILQQKQSEIQNQQGEQQKKNYIYVPDVIKNQKMSYFRFPKLGAYFCIRMNIKSYIQENLIQKALQQTLKYKKNVEQNQLLKQKKQSQFRQIYEQKQRQNADQNQLQQLIKKHQQEKSLIIDIPLPILPHINRNFIICFDTLGSGEQINETSRTSLLKYVQNYKSSWQNKELSYLKVDIQNQIKYLNQFDQSQSHHSKITDDLQRQIETEIEQTKKQSLGEHQLAYEIESIRLKKIKEHLNEEKYRSYFEILLNMNIIRYSGIIQAVLYFLGYDKKTINVVDTNILNWRKTKLIIKNKKIIQQLISYNPRGLKTKIPLPYAKWNKLILFLQKYDLYHVSIYNLTLAKILQYMLTAAKLRRLDIQIRKQKFFNQTKLREQKKIQYDHILQQKQILKAEAIKAAAQKNNQEFDLESWQKKYDQQHPLPQIGQQIVFQVDKDFDIEEN